MAPNGRSASRAVRPVSGVAGCTSPSIRRTTLPGSALFGESWFRLFLFVRLWAMDKSSELKKIEKEISTCRICKKDSIGLLVFGEGNINAKIIFVGEAPGKKEAATGKPFIGRSGQLLRQNIRKIGLKEKDVYISSPVKYLPKRGTPSKQQIAHGMTHFREQLKIINPNIFVLMGSVAALAVLGQFVPVAKMHGQTIKKDGKIYFISYHPAAAIRFVKYKSIFESDFRKLKKLL